VVRLGERRITAVETEAMIAEQKPPKSRNITVKVPLTWDGLKAARFVGDG